MISNNAIREFPDDISQEVMDKVVKRAVENPYSTYTTEELKKAAPAPSTLRDLNEAGALGMAGGIKALTDLFGVDNAASKKMEELQLQAFKNMTPERQREMAIRAGVNLVMYAMTGNYKSDQVHVRDLLERLGL